VGAGHRRAITVLNQQVRSRHAGNTVYGSIVDGGLPEGVRNVQFTWIRGLFGRYDVLHIHWPDRLVRGHGLRGAGRLLACAALLVRIAATRAPVVRTAHNLVSHDQLGTLERWFCTCVDRLTTVVIRLTPEGAPALDVPTVVIPHPHYEEVFGTFDQLPAEPGLFVFAGHLRRYKGIEELLTAFADIDDRRVRLRVVGAAEDPQLAEQLLEGARRDARVSIGLGAVPDAVFVEELTRAQVVVLPYRDFYNSGVLLAALSVGRPVLVPRSATTEALAREVGAGWLLLYDGPITGRLLMDALERMPSPPADRPTFLARDPTAVGAQHHAVYLAAARR